MSFTPIFLTFFFKKRENSTHYCSLLKEVIITIIKKLLQRSLFKMCLRMQSLLVDTILHVFNYLLNIPKVNYITIFYIVQKKSSYFKGEGWLEFLLIAGVPDSFWIKVPFWNLYWDRFELHFLILKFIRTKFLPL